jgi:hypothetical protein
MTVQMRLSRLTLQPAGIEGIAGLEITAFKSNLEPTHPLG